MGGRPRTAEVRKADARRLRAQGLSEAEIAARMGMERSTIIRYFREDRIERELAVATFAEESVTPTEIEKFRATCQPGTIIKAKVPDRKGADMEDTGVIEVRTRIVAMYKYVARTEHGCFRWADLVLANRKGKQ